MVAAREEAKVRKAQAAAAAKTQRAKDAEEAKLRANEAAERRKQAMASEALEAERAKTVLKPQRVFCFNAL